MTDHAAETVQRFNTPSGEVGLSREFIGQTLAQRSDWGVVGPAIERHAAKYYGQGASYVRVMRLAQLDCR